MPAWIHGRAEHILAKNPNMPKGEAFAIATQQGEALGKTPKGFGTRSGKIEAKKKYKTPEDDKKTAEAQEEYVKMSAFYDELHKMGAISDEEARRAMDRLDTLERTKPNASQLGRFAAVGATAAPVARVIGNVIKKGPRSAFDFGGSTTLRGLAGEAATGALGAGSIPFIHSQLNRRSEMGTLKDYLSERAGQQKLGFQTSEYSGPLSYGPFQHESLIPAFRQPSLEAPPPIPAKKKLAFDPAGALKHTEQTGMHAPSLSGSIANSFKPKGEGSGRPLPGAMSPNTPIGMPRAPSYS